MKFKHLFESKITKVEIDPALHEGESDLYKYCLKQFNMFYTDLLHEKSLEMHFIINGEQQHLLIYLRYLKSRSSFYTYKSGWNEIHLNICENKKSSDVKSNIIAIFSHELQHMIQAYGDRRIDVATHKKINPRKFKDLKPEDLKDVKLLNKITYQSYINNYKKRHNQMPTEHDSEMAGLLEIIKIGHYDYIPKRFKEKYFSELNPKKFIQKAYSYGLTNNDLSKFKTWVKTSNLPETFAKKFFSDIKFETKVDTDQEKNIDKKQTIENAFIRMKTDKLKPYIEIFKKFKQDVLKNGWWEEEDFNKLMVFVFDSIIWNNNKRYPEIKKVYDKVRPIYLWMSKYRLRDYYNKLPKKEKLQELLKQCTENDILELYLKLGV